MATPTEKIKAHAAKLGFQHLGITNQHVPQSYKHYLRWVNEGYHQNMWYLAEDSRREKRSSAAWLLPSVHSILVGTFSYHPQKDHPSNAKFARYGWGKDYHEWVKGHFEELSSFMHDDLGLSFEKKITVDTAPILERDFAQMAGAGWIGKNTMLMNQKGGSYLYLGVMLTSLTLDEDAPTTAHCGTCTACIDACPTDAIEQPFVLNPAKCISYHTLENRKEEIPASIEPHLDGWVAGCDICQEVCPWNHKAAHTHLEETKAERHTNLSLAELIQLDQEDFARLFRGTSFQRTGLKKIQNNAKSALKGKMQTRKA